MILQQYYQVSHEVRSTADCSIHIQVSKIVSSKYKSGECYLVRLRCDMLYRVMSPINIVPGCDRISRHILAG